MQHPCRSGKVDVQLHKTNAENSIRYTVTEFCKLLAGSYAHRGSQNLASQSKQLSALCAQQYRKTQAYSSVEYTDVRTDFVFTTPNNNNEKNTAESPDFCKLRS